MEDFDLAEFRKMSVPSEKEITASWVSIEPLVSIVCTSFNHEQYIKDAIHGFLIQKTDFPYEIIMHDDASTDNTQKIIREYAAIYPNIIKTIFQVENKYSQGLKILLLSSGYASGQYVAFCEGDDFWFASNKLQLQINEMQKFPLAEICFHSSVKMIGDIAARHLFCKRANENKLFDVKPIILCGGSFMPTASMLIRKSFFDRVFLDTTDFFKRYMMGFCCQIFSSLNGGALYIDRPMAVYRSFSEGSWTQTMSMNHDFYVQWLSSYLGMLRVADKKTNLEFHAEFSLTIKRCHLSVLNNVALDLGFRRNYFHNNKAEMGMSGSLLWFLVNRMPVVHGLIKRFRALARSILNYF